VGRTNEAEFDPNGGGVEPIMNNIVSMQLLYFLHTTVLYLEAVSAWILEHPYQMLIIISAIFLMSLVIWFIHMCFVLLLQKIAERVVNYSPTPYTVTIPAITDDGETNTSFAAILLCCLNNPTTAKRIVNLRQTKNQDQLRDIDVPELGNSGPNPFKSIVDDYVVVDSAVDFTISSGITMSMKNTEYTTSIMTIRQPASIVLTSYVYDTSQIRDFIDLCRKEYYKSQMEYNNRVQRLFVYNGQDAFEEYPFQSSKTFDNLFFTEKNRLRRAIDQFRDNEESYVRLGVPYKLGLLFHGKPGTGKTSTIKAIANHTKRHVVSISMANIKTCSQLRQALRTVTINQKHIPSNKCIYVFEDVDCMVPSRDANIITSSGETTATESDSINLSYLLNVMDGLHESHGRIVIFTTNYKNRLDPALIRAGRVDCDVCFGDLTRSDASEIIALYNPQLGKEVVESTAAKYVSANSSLTASELCMSLLIPPN
jgi:AAA+ superfamily predicted ATPase